MLGEEPNQDPEPVREWKRTARWSPGRTGRSSGGVPVECPETGEIGFCKPVKIVAHREKICSDLARIVGVSVPRVRLGRLEGHTAIFPVSLVHASGKKSLDVDMLRTMDTALYASPSVQRAIRNASGLLAFHAWVKTNNIEDEHLLIADDGAGNYRIAAIDFSGALQWKCDKEPVEPPVGPPVLLIDPDRSIVEAAVKQVESCLNSAIETIVHALPEDVLCRTGKDRIILCLEARRFGIKEAMDQRKWLPQTNALKEPG